MFYFIYFLKFLFAIFVWEGNMSTRPLISWVSQWKALVEAWMRVEAKAFLLFSLCFGRHFQQRQRVEQQLWLLCQFALVIPVSALGAFFLLSASGLVLYLLSDFSSVCNSGVKI